MRIRDSLDTQASVQVLTTMFGLPKPATKQLSSIGTSLGNHLAHLHWELVLGEEQNDRTVFVEFVAQ
jgi:hypothetical protein